MIFSWVTVYHYLVEIVEAPSTPTMRRLTFQAVTKFPRITQPVNRMTILSEQCRY